ncbi:MAG: UDP-N-acetylmuramate dehydrogenase [Zetaproteobacteria bacterium]|nr:MAG: UDP-N-acetylmuramate dehydrogenase [Zetaproteobacteria bacterium]
MIAGARRQGLEALAMLGKVLRDEPMARHTTLGVGGPADWFFQPRDRDALARAMPLIPADMPRLPLGRGSNLLVLDGGFRGVVIDMAGLNVTRLTGNELYAEAGARMSRVASLCAAQGLSGLEFLATVPGNIGGGVAMNAGAFGQEIADCLQRVEVMDGEGRCMALERSSLAMGYRCTRLPEGALVVAACFRLQAMDAAKVRQRMRAMREQRGKRQPLSWPNCGSVFKNPPGDYAARLIEAAGLKGMRIGGARISERHANFIVNEGDATAADVLALIERAREAVWRQAGVRLETEVRIVGEKR